MGGRRKPEEKERVLKMAREKNPAKTIAGATGVPLETVYYWLRNAGITPPPPAKASAQKRPSGRKKAKVLKSTPPKKEPGVKTLGNLPLALRIERGVRRRVAEMDDAA